MDSSNARTLVRPYTGLRPYAGQTPAGPINPFAAAAPLFVALLSRPGRRRLALLPLALLAAVLLVHATNGKRLGSHQDWRSGRGKRPPVMVAAGKSKPAMSKERGLASGR